MRILVLHPGALGDIILALPTIELLRRCYTAASITLAGNLDFLSAAARGFADSLISLSLVPLHRLYAAGMLPAEDVRFWTSFDLIVSWTGSADDGFASRLVSVARSARVAAWRPAPGEARHVSRIFFDSLRPWPGADPGTMPLPRIRPSEEKLCAAQRWLSEKGLGLPAGPLVAVHPGAGSLEKRWPSDRFRELLRLMTEGGEDRFVVIEGPAEDGSSCEVTRGLPPGRVTAAAALPLELVGGLLGHCSAFIGNDSGIAHLAAGTGCSSLVLFGPTDPSLWAPLGKSVDVLRDTSGCEKCAGGAGRHSCMENLTVEQVRQQLNR